ncbi:phosphoribosylamine--glycine ligase [Caminibacter pacificus]|uniref:Phosphoribosylamine--glycine ligase n=1 Tax=Caminibacter pacificus TaxID=1424653 RepID=A0AAJ4UYD1_9BACT|nr:phosphoribosylamine--glycine ligase [Caminibacter pacificus]QCI28481.1 phosphoribosylamine--glycine ligase [Caminibacter pacificus]ROR40792.1 phosphoribosylamine--glycine ligase [Caminibacter pacificus]
MKKVLIIGGGGREYSIGYFMKDEAEIFYAPGNGATEEFATNIDIKDFEELANWAKENNIDLTIVGPEDPLVKGVVDVFKSHGLTIFGPSSKAARLEGSKVYMKNFLKKHNIPTARYIETDDKQKAYEFIDSMDKLPIVVKADGLCAGKGVIIAESKEEAKKTVEDMLSGKAFGDAGKKVIVEEFLDGYELSMFAICDGEDFVLLPAAQDHKRLLDGDKGPNTGGMGAYAPTPLANEELYEKVKSRIIKPTLKGMQEEGAPFEGVLFIGLMIVDNEPYVLEYNVRFGDPECEELMALIDSSVYDMFFNGATKQLDKIDVKIKDMVAVGVVCASKNYPYSSSEPAEITVDDLSDCNGYIAYAGVKKIDGKLMATGGRVLVCVGFGKDVKQARDEAYKIVDKVHFEGKKYRKDIAYQAIGK